MVVYIVQMYDSRCASYNPCVIAFSTEKEASEYVDQANKNLEYTSVLFGYKSCWLNVSKGTP